MKRLVAILSFAVPAAVVAQRIPDDALFVGRTTADRAEYHLRTDKIQKVFQGHSVWVYQVLPAPKALEFGPKKGQTFNYSISNWIISCPTAAMTISQTAFYKTGGTLVTSESYGDGALERVVPDSVGDGVLDAACKHLGIQRP